MKEEIKTRKDWDKPEKWPGDDEKPLLLDGVPENKFDKDEWEWSEPESKGEKRRAETRAVDVIDQFARPV